MTLICHRRSGSRSAVWLHCWTRYVHEHFWNKSSSKPVQLPSRTGNQSDSDRTQLVDPLKPVNEEAARTRFGFRMWARGGRQHPEVTQPAAACCASSHLSAGSRFRVVTESGWKNQAGRWFCCCLNLSPQLRTLIGWFCSGSISSESTRRFY